MCRRENRDSKVTKRSYLQKNVKGMSETQWGRKKSCDEVETVKGLTYHGDRVSAGRGCEVAVTVRTRCGQVTSKECGELLY